MKVPTKIVVWIVTTQYSTIFRFYEDSFMSCKRQNRLIVT